MFCRTNLLKESKLPHFVCGQTCVVGDDCSLRPVYFMVGWLESPLPTWNCCSISASIIKMFLALWLQREPCNHEQSLHRVCREPVTIALESVPRAIHLSRGSGS